MNNAGWSSLEARRAHNPKVIGSNPIPAISAQIAQSVEQRTENPRVTGSIPVLGIILLQKAAEKAKTSFFCRYIYVILKTDIAFYRIEWREIWI